MCENVSFVRTSALRDRVRSHAKAKGRRHNATKKRAQKGGKLLTVEGTARALIFLFAVFTKNVAYLKLAM